MSEQKQNIEGGVVDIEQIVVLKFGGSVLREDRCVADVVHEIYRWVRDGYRVVAVVSAIEGQTDALLGKVEQFGQGASDGAAALLLSTGELQSAALLGLALGKAGIEASVLPISAIGLRTLGEALDADPVSLDVSRLRQALARVSVAVVPGFTGVGLGGQWTVLGRGGSDLTALFLAQQLGARCRLVKDVDGLYEWDPAKPRNGAKGKGTVKPRKFAQIDIEDALQLGGHIVQNKALRFVREHGQTFEVGTFAVSDGTSVTTTGRSLLAAQRFEAAREPRLLRVAILGCGTVGQGVASLLAQQVERCVITGILVKNERKLRAGLEDSSILTSNFERAIEQAELLIETIGGVDEAERFVEKSLALGKHVVTANKALIAQSGERLTKLARKRGVQLLYSAAVGGAVTVLETARRLRRLAESGGPRIDEICGVINGTTNFVLEYVLSKGVTEEHFEQAVRAAQVAGFAEADASRDLLGEDIADKLVLLIREAFGVWIDRSEIVREGLCVQGIVRVLSGASPGQRPRYVAWVEHNDGRISAGVGLRLVSLNDALSDVRGEHNRVVFELTDGRAVSIAGRGAGRWPTAQAVVADALDVWRSWRCADQSTGKKERAGVDVGR